MEDRRLISLAYWGRKLEKKHRKLMRKINALNAEYERFFEEYNKVIPEEETLEEILDGILLDDLKETFELDI